LNYTDFPIIQEDDITGTKFGTDYNLTILGWISKHDGVKKYVCECTICKKDPEMYGDGLFPIWKSYIIKGTIPCGCSKGTRYSEAQVSTLAKRIASEKGYTFNHIVGDFKGIKTKISLTCSKHGEWKTNTTDNLRFGKGCPECKRDKIVEVNRHPDNEFIKTVLSIPSFHPETKIKRSIKKNTRGRGDCWDVLCGLCQESYTSVGSKLKIGQRGCSCSKDPRECYINLIIDNDTPIAVKFGVATSSKSRRQSQQRGCVHKVKTLFRYSFNTSAECKLAEKECKLSLITNILQKSDMKDGFTETTYCYNIENIKEIYKKHGGTLIE